MGHRIEKEIQWAGTYIQGAGKKLTSKKGKQGCVYCVAAFHKLQMQIEFTGRIMY
jgi:hypothetical protein